MKKIIYSTILILVSILLVSCSNKIQVKFDYNNGTIGSKTSSTIKVEKGSKLLLPTKYPVKTNHIFSGWLYNGSLVKDNDLVVTTEITLLAKYDVDQTKIPFSFKQINEEERAQLEFENLLKFKKVEVLDGGKSIFTSQLVNNKKFISQIPLSYGIHQISVVLQSDNPDTVIEKEVHVKASEYNIAPLTGTLPVLTFSLSLFGENNLTINPTTKKNIPTYISSLRSKTINYDNLPDNVYPMPNIALDKLKNGSNFVEVIKAADSFIKDIMIMDGNAKINLYLNDYSTDLYLKFLIANNVKNYSVILLSDGTFSYQTLTDKFNVEKPKDVEKDVITKINTLYEQVKTEKDYYQNKDKFILQPSDMRYYMYLVSKNDKNVSWWLKSYTLKKLVNFNSATQGFKDYITEISKDTKNVVDVNLSKLFTNIYANEDLKTSFNSFLNVNNSLFDDVKKENKKAFIILGTTASYETNLEEYVKTIKKLLGSDYIYYYKGHPAEVDSLNDKKTKLLKDLDLKVIDPSIPAELLFLPNRETNSVNNFAYSAGYHTSTFNTLNDSETFAAFNSTQQSSLDRTYKQNLDVYMSLIKNDTFSNKELLSNVDDKYILVEVDDTKVSKYNYKYAIYNSNNDSIKYYDSSYKEVVING